MNKVTSIAHKRSIFHDGVRYGAGDEEALDKALTEAQKKRYAEFGLIELGRETKKKDEV